VVLDRLRRRLTWSGTTGTPHSANGASSLHLFWDVPDGDWVAAEANLEVVGPPRVAALSFWALQVSFTDRGRDGGGAHLGLQWFAPHPGSTAVNWGGYRPGGGELAGSASTLPSATGNENTRDLAWEAHRPYRLRVRRGTSTPPEGLHAWTGDITDQITGATTVVRDLWAAGTHLSGPMVWSEVFARCDDPGSAVRWSGLRLVDESGARHEVASVVVNYQAVGDGGCITTDASADDQGIVQATGAVRRTSPGTRLTVPDPPVGGEPSPSANPSGPAAPGGRS